MDGPTDYQTKQTKSEIKRQTSYGIAYMWHLKQDTNEVIYKTDVENKLVTASVGVQGRDGLWVWDEQMQTIIYRIDKQGPAI